MGRGRYVGGRRGGRACGVTLFAFSARAAPQIAAAARQDTYYTLPTPTIDNINARLPGRSSAYRIISNKYV